MADGLFIADDAGRARCRRREASAAYCEDHDQGWAFVGPTTVHAFVQATGQVKNHLEGRSVRAAALAARAAPVVPRP